jgi:NADH dehydrogenase
VAEAIKNSDAVVNLVGVLKGDFEGLHIDGARNVAEGCALEGVVASCTSRRSAPIPTAHPLMAAPKGDGEQAVRTIFARATIVRPSIVFGREDNFINRFAGMARLAPVLPVVRGPVKFQPVYAADVGRAVVAALSDPRAHGGKTYELGGPQVLTMRELMQWINETTGHNRMLIDVPDAGAKLLARGFGWAPGAPITWDHG